MEVRLENWQTLQCKTTIWALWSGMLQSKMAYNTQNPGMLHIHRVQLRPILKLEKDFGQLQEIQTGQKLLDQKIPSKKIWRKKCSAHSAKS